MNEMSFFVQRLIRLCYMVIILFICCHIDNFICNTRIFLICLINLSVRRFYETILIDSRIRSQRVNQTDVRTFRGLNRTHSSVMGVVDISYLESGSVSGQTARSKCGKTSLMCQLTQRVVLIHELGQLRRTEEFFHCCSYRFDINQGLR